MNKKYYHKSSIKQVSEQDRNLQDAGGSKLSSNSVQLFMTKAIPLLFLTLLFFMGCESRSYEVHRSVGKVTDVDMDYSAWNGYTTLVEFDSTYVSFYRKVTLDKRETYWIVRDEGLGVRYLCSESTLESSEALRKTVRKHCNQIY